MDDARPILEILSIVIPVALIALALGVTALWAARIAARRHGARGAPRRDRARARSCGLPPAPAVPASSLARLHLACGASGRLVAQAACDLAVHWLARGERVLLVDGGPRLRLHTAFSLSPRAGLLDYLETVSPLLAHVQHAAVPGFYVLVHGVCGTRPSWAGFGRLLEDSRPYFDRVILALDPGASLSLAAALAREDLDAWWADPRPEQRVGARALADRLGITFNGIKLQRNTDPLPDYLEARLAAMRPASERAATAPPAAPQVATAAPSPPAPARTSTLDCDLHVRERLRFLLWMKGLQSREGSRATAAPSVAPAPQPELVTSG